MPQGATTRAVPPRWPVPAAGLVLLIASLAAFASIGGPDDPLIVRIATVLDLLIRAGLPAAAYLLAGVGLGEAFRPFVRASREATALRSALGVGLMLTVSHAEGVFGLLGMWAALAPVAVGMALLLWGWAGERPRPAPAMSGLLLIAVPALALMLVAASSPPGWLWGSEAGGYDALEYHLELPKEWLASGRVWPVAHNVYSFLPGYVEAAFTHLAAMTGAARSTGSGGMLAGDGWRLIGCQMLSAGFATFAAAMVGRFAMAAARRIGLASSGPTLAGFGAGALLLCTPWTIVVGSLAYNDLVMLAFTAAAMTAAIDPDLKPLARWGATGALVGFACCCKPTALFLAGVPAGILLLALSPVRLWALSGLAGTVSGSLTIVPWLLRNWLAIGNPVFPFGAKLFGNGPWTGAQVARYQAAHSFHGSLAERIGLLIIADPTDAAGPVQRGLMHPQWFAFFPLCVLAAAVVVGPARRRFAVVLIGAFLAQLGAWLFFTHVQSRFLLPMAALGCALVGVALARAAAGAKPAFALGGAAPLVACGVQLAASIVIFAQQRGGAPNALLTAGPGFRTGRAFAGGGDRALQDAGPEAYINLTTRPGDRVYLLGDATPLYYSADVVYNTTFDTWPFGEAVRAAPGDPGAWTGALKQRGITRVLVNFGELARLARSGWIDPAVTREAVESWLRSGPRIIREWPDIGCVLVALPGSTP